MNARNFLFYLVTTGFAFLTSCNPAEKKQASLDKTRFKRVVLAEEAQGLIGATEFDIASNGKIYLVDLSGHLRIFDPSTKKLKAAAEFEGGEFGLIGIKLDPDFVTNSFIYLQYFVTDSSGRPAVRDHRIMHISRFTVSGDSLDRLSEKNYLKIPYEDACCHTGGGMAFDEKGNLYVSTGDNTDAFYTQYSPVVDIPGQDLINDDLRSAGNTNDDRGKIIRIHPQKDGSFTIPDGNLFPPGTAKTKPEIYVMGVRNPYRITIDRKTGYLFWGEVGPDAAKDSTAGPRGYDEFNIAKEAGNFGWPLVIGNNQAYPHIYYNEGRRIGEKTDTLHPVNYSVNNTGLKDLPPAHPALIWYPYDSSSIFKSFGAGGRTAIGGPFYQYSDLLDSKVKFPKALDHCWFIADWMRNWVKVVSFNDSSTIKEIRDFLPDTLFRKPICMKFGPDGALYVLEFGSTWGENPDARLVRLEYLSGNRSPVAKLDADKVYGKTPLIVSFSASRTIDYDDDQLQYEWRDDKGKVLAKGMQAKLAFDKPGKYRVRLAVKDANGAESFSDTIITAGNAMPVVSIAVGNQTFFSDTLHYSVHVQDEEDGTIGHGINPAALKVSLQYYNAALGFNAAHGMTRTRGEILLNESDCNSCHQLIRKSAGPSFTDIAQRYSSKPGEIPRLVEKVLKGGSGVWGKTNMSAHPQLNTDQVKQIIEYIFSMERRDNPATVLAGSGSLALAKENKDAQNGFYELEATYTDRGAPSAIALTSQARLTLRSPTVKAVDFEQLYEGIVEDNKFSGRHGSGAAIKNIDLTGIRQLLLLGSGNGYVAIHLDSANGPVIAKAFFKQKHKEEVLSVSISAENGFHSVYFEFISGDERFSEIYLRWMRFGSH